MHPVQQRWCEQLKKRFPVYFKNKKVLDVGSLDVNGNNKYLFENCEYTGLDIVPGKNVDIISIAHKYAIIETVYDVVLSTNSLEHDLYYVSTLQKMADLLKRKGFMFFSVATSWHEHGTTRTTPNQSGTSQMGDDWKNYYKNLSEEDVRNAINIDKIFSQYEFSTEDRDLRFWGIKV
jgi:SAM-dependent methyltransferase